jgi:tetratricopeptide (TPR) repeat protein
MRVLSILLVLCAASTGQAHATNNPFAEARRHMAEGRLPEAVRAFRSATEADSTNPAVWRGLASALHRLERYREALTALDRAMSLNRNDFATRFNRALTLSELGQIASAAAELDTALTLRADLAPVWAERGAARALLGRVAEARDDWQKALELDPSFVWSRFYRGLASVSTGDYRAAAVDLDSVTQRESLLSAHLWRWVAYRLDGRSAPALPARTTEWPGPIASFLAGELSEEQLLAAAAPGPGAIDRRRMAAAHFYIGSRHLADGREAEARAAFTRAVETPAPRHAEIVAAESMLRRSRPR